MRWLHGWPPIPANSDHPPTAVLMGTGVNCIGCGRFQGITCVAIDPDWIPPTEYPDWPFPQDSCPICWLQDRDDNHDEPKPWPRGKPRPLP